MPFRRLTAAILVFLMFSGSGFAQNRDQVYQEGVDALYSLYFSTAEDRFRAITRMEPDDPLAWSTVASTLWLEIVAAQEKLNMDSFSGASIGTENSRDSVSAEMEAKLRVAVDTTILKADARLARNKNDVQALYAKGIAKAAIAAFQAVVKGSTLGAFRDAKAARELHLQALKLDPTFKDAALTPGLYDYALGSLPGAVRLLLGFFFVPSGNKARGLAAVQDVAEHGKRSSTDAKMLLVVMYNRERQFPQALSLVQELHKSHPQNYLLEITEAALYSRLRNFDRSIAAYNDVLSRIESRKDGYERLEPEKVLLLLAKAYLDSGDAGKAQVTYQKIIALPAADATDKANAHLWLGKMEDANLHRASAIVHYDAILALDCTARLKDEARKFKARPYK